MLNLIVLASLSSACGTPGIRLGYIYSYDPTIIAAVENELPVRNMSAIAEYLLELLVDYRSEYEESISKAIAERERLRLQLMDLPIVRTVYPSEANFLLILLNHPEGVVASVLRQELLANHGITVNDVTNRFLDNLPRLLIGVRRQEDNRHLLEILRSYKTLPLAHS